MTMLVCPRRVGATPQSTPPPKAAPPAQAPPKPSPEQAENQALTTAVRSSLGNPQALIRNLEDFLTRFPDSPQRPMVLRTIYQTAMQANDPVKAAGAAEQLLALNPDDPAMLVSLVGLLDRQNDAAKRAAALRYATQLVVVAEKAAQRPKPAEVSDAKWRESRARLLATAYLARGEVLAGSGEIAPAIDDYAKSFAAYPTAEVAEHLGDLAVKQGDTARAIEEYGTAFTFPGKDLDPAHREELRRKLGSLYLAQHGSEKGLGDLVLRRYDELMRSIGGRFTDQHASNADRQDPFDFVLGRPDGGELRLADYRGKVVVMDFWATWCPPCRIEGKLLERVEENFHNEPATAFLAVNVDEDRDGVPAFVRQYEWTTPIAYAQGLDHLLGVRALPTVVIFDRTGRVVFREEGLDPSTFIETLEKKVREILAQPSVAAGSQ